jgi:hypothetical protein
MQMMHKLMLGTALCVASGLLLGDETAWAKAVDASAQRPACRSAAARPLKLLRSTVVVENGVSPSAERIGRRANYTPVPRATNAREQASFLVFLEKQPKPANLIVGVGY